MKEIMVAAFQLPWSSAVPFGWKAFETRGVRGWQARRCGVFAIQATAAKPKRGIIEAIASALPPELELTVPSGVLGSNSVTGVGSDLVRRVGQPGVLPTGAIICVAEIVEYLVITPKLAAQQTPLELAFGNWSWDEPRFAIRMESIQPLPQPIPAKNCSRGPLRILAPEYVEQIEAQISL